MSHVIRRAVATDLSTLLHLRDEASEWLSQKGSDQWSEAWPDPDTMVSTIQRSIRDGHTWCIEDESAETVATIAMDRHTFHGLWTEAEEAEPAVYIHRLIVRRNSAGCGIGAQLLDWAGTKAAKAGVRWIRVDVWTTNLELQQYYVWHGFEHVRTVVRNDYPSGALLQRRAEVRLTPHLTER